MKKFFIIVPSLVIIFLFIVLNYLIWDRQNKIVLDSSKDATISALGREIQNMETTEKSLRDRLSKLETDLRGSENNVDSLNKDKAKLQETLVIKNDTLEELKKTADLSTAATAVRSWVEFLSKGQYENAYNLQLPTALGHQMTLEEFQKQWEGKIKSIKISADKPVLAPTTEGKNGEIVCKYTIEIVRVPDTGKYIFEEGKNDKLFTVIFSQSKNSWLIASVE